VGFTAPARDSAIPLGDNANGFIAPLFRQYSQKFPLSTPKKVVAFFLIKM
jgi:hypothetical protein